MHERLSRFAGGGLRMAALLAVLGGLLAYAIGSGSLGFGTGSAATDDCPGTDAPAVALVGRPALLAQAAVLRRIGAERGGRAYEQGPAEASYVWSDAEPGYAAGLPVAPRQPGGYEVRWWFPDRTDVVADVFFFADAGQARDFAGRAAAAECRSRAAAVPASVPPGARNLAWTNPDGFAQEDAFLQRGRRVYRISAVLPGTGPRATSAGRREGLALADMLASGLPAALVARASE